MYVKLTAKAREAQIAIKQREIDMWKELPTDDETDAGELAEIKDELAHLVAMRPPGFKPPGARRKGKPSPR